MFTDIFIKRPVLATVVSLFVLVLGLHAIGSLSVRQYPFTQNAVVTVSTTYVGADPDVIAGFINDDTLRNEGLAKPVQFFIRG